MRSMLLLVALLASVQGKLVAGYDSYASMLSTLRKQDKTVTSEMKELFAADDALQTRVTQLEGALGASAPTARRSLRQQVVEPKDEFGGREGAAKSLEDAAEHPEQFGTYGTMLGKLHKQTLKNAKQLLALQNAGKMLKQQVSKLEALLAGGPGAGAAAATAAVAVVPIDVPPAGRRLGAHAPRRRRGHQQHHHHRRKRKTTTTTSTTTSTAAASSAADSTSPPPAAACVCDDSCEWTQDGECDDGGPGSSSGSCNRGTDCTDCGPSQREVRVPGGTCADRLATEVLGKCPKMFRTPHGSGGKAAEAACCLLDRAMGVVDLIRGIKACYDGMDKGEHRKPTVASAGIGCFSGVRALHRDLLRCPRGIAESKDILDHKLAHAAFTCTGKRDPGACEEAMYHCIRVFRSLTRSARKLYREGESGSGSGGNVLTPAAARFMRVCHEPSLSAGNPLTVRRLMRSPEQLAPSWSPAARLMHGRDHVRSPEQLDRWFDDQAKSPKATRPPQTKAALPKWKPCEPGFYRQRSTCKPCFAGKYAGKSSTGLQKCFKCPYGKYSPKAASVCTKCSNTGCAPGEFRHGCHGGYPGTCHACSLGRFLRESQCEQCGECPAGRFVEICGGADPLTCRECPAGKYVTSKTKLESDRLPADCFDCAHCSPLTADDPGRWRSRVRVGCHGASKGRCEIGDTAAPTPMVTAAPTPSPRQVLAVENKCLQQMLSWTQGLNDVT